MNNNKTIILDVNDRLTEDIPTALNKEWPLTQQCCSTNNIFHVTKAKH